MNLYCDKSFSYPRGTWIEANSIGEGSKSVVNGLLTTIGSSPQLYACYLINPGETLRFSVMAKCSSAGGIIAIDVDNKAEGAYDVFPLPVKNTFDRYEISRTCPLTKTNGEIVIVVVGNGAAFSDASTNTKFYDPRVELVGGVVARPSLRTMSSGLIRLTASDRGIHPTFNSSGIYSISLGTTDITVTLPHVYGKPSETITPKRPLVFVSATPDYGFLHAQAGGVYTDANGRLYFTIKLYDAEGTVLNPSTIINAFIFFEVKAP